MSARLPEHLHAAHAWTEAAGELATLRDTRDNALAVYVALSVANWHEHRDGAEVTQDDLFELHEWLQQNSGERSTP